MPPRNQGSNGTKRNEVDGGWCPKHALPEMYRFRKTVEGVSTNTPNESLVNVRRESLQLHRLLPTRRMTKSIAKQVAPEGHSNGRQKMIDFHFMRCKEDHFIYQPCNAVKGNTDPNKGCVDRRGDPEIWTPTLDEPENIRSDRLISKFCCCKTGGKVGPIKPILEP